MAETKTDTVKADHTGHLKSLRADSKESEELQAQGWVVTEIKKVDGVKMHFLQKPKKDE